MFQTMRAKLWRAPLAMLCQVLILHPAMAQQAPAQRSLRLVVVGGAEARNVVQQIAPKPLIVRVEDDRRPIAGATVVFTAPQSGPGGEFENDSRTLTVVTGQDGLANAGAYHPNASAGPYQIRVNAQFQGATATAYVSQINVAEKKGHGKLIATMLILGAAGGAAIAYRNKTGGSSSPSSSALTIGFGGAAVGAPR